MGPELGKISAMDIAQALFQVVIDLFSLLFLLMRSLGKLAAETLFLANYSLCIGWMEFLRSTGEIQEKLERFTRVICPVSLD